MLTMKIVASAIFPVCELLFVFVIRINLILILDIQYSRSWLQNKIFVDCLFLFNNCQSDVRSHGDFQGQRSRSNKAFATFYQIKDVCISSLHHTLQLVPLLHQYKTTCICIKGRTENVSPMFEFLAMQDCMQLHVYAEFNVSVNCEIPS